LITALSNKDKGDVNKRLHERGKRFVLPVVSGVVSLGFPTIHPSTGIDKAARAVKRRSRVDHVGGRSKEFVGNMHNGGASSRASQVCDTEEQRMRTWS
jgi:hypothetical protein